MKNNFHILLLVTLFLGSNSGYSQMYILNEDFSTATGATPPANWQNITTQGQLEATWRFDNPGNRLVNFPVTLPFAILDAPQVSPDAAIEVVTLETPDFDASQGIFFLLFLDHFFIPDSAATAKILAYDGSNWIEVASFNAATEANPSSEVIDLTSIVAGLTNAKLRFEWTGHGKGFWAIDNVRIYSALYLDAGISNIDSPTMPFIIGNHEVRVSLKNYGFDTLETANLKLEVDGVLQPSVVWNGSILAGCVEDDILLCVYNFAESREYTLKVWSEFPNGFNDPNFHNDTTSRVIRPIRPPLCGIYTIGGTDPDFNGFNEAVSVLNESGVNCSVIFKVRDGFYNESIVITQIAGTSSVNTVTFQSESEDSTRVVISSGEEATNTIIINGAQYINFKNLGISYNYYWSGPIFHILSNSTNISVKNCRFTGTTIHQAIYLENDLDSISIISNYFDAASFNYGIFVRNAGFVEIKKNIISGSNSWAVFTHGNVRDLRIESNAINGSFCGIGFESYLNDTVSILNNVISNTTKGIQLGSNNVGSFKISGNRITGITEKGIYIPANVWGNTYSLQIINNFIQTEGEDVSTGLQIEGNTVQSEILFNSINNTSTNGLSRAFEIVGSTNMTIKNNIFSNQGPGYAVYIPNPLTACTLDFNDYFSGSDRFGHMNGTNYYSLQNWIIAISGETNGRNLNPYFVNSASYKVYQCGLNGAGIAIPGIFDDIENEIRNPLAPDIGCDEFEFPSHLFGIVFHDVNQNGIQDENEYGLPGRLISIQPGNIIAMTDSTGIWTDEYVPAGTYIATAYVPENWALSTPQDQSFFFMDTTVTTWVPSFGMYSTEPCPKAEVTITAPELIKCFPEQMVYVTAKNNITATGALSGGYVEVELDPLILLDSATLTYTTISDNKYRFEVGDLNPGEEVNFSLSTTVSCNAMNSQTLCMQANIYPVDSCALDTIPNPPIGVSPCLLPWDKSSLHVDGWCANDTVYFSITNTGEPGHGDMVCYSPVRIYLDGVFTQFDSIQLAGNQTVYYTFPGNGQTWRLEVDQHPLHPGHSHPNASVEACGDMNNWTPGLINNFPLDDADRFVDIYCGMVTGDWEQAEKTGYPLGLEQEGYILPGQGLQYMINFQNTNTDTAALVVIRDTLDMNLNIFTVVTGASSHPFTFRMFGQRVLEWRFDNISLPPASVNELASQGFLTFQAEQYDSLESGTQIYNEADIFFEYQTPVNGQKGLLSGDEGHNITNLTLHTINNLIIQPPFPASAGEISGDASVCQGQNDVIYSVPEVDNATGYFWSLPSGWSIEAGNNTNNIIVSFSDTAQSGNISVYGTNSFGNGVASSLAVTVNPLLPVGVSVYPSANPVDYGTTVTFTAVPENGGVPTYQWYVNDLPVESGGDSYSYIPANNDQVYVVMTSSLSCVSSATATSNIVIMNLNDLTKTLNVSALLEGLYNGGGAMRKARNEIGNNFDLPLYPENTADMVTIELHDAMDYSIIIYSINNLVLSTSGAISVALPEIFSDSCESRVKILKK